MGFPDYGKSPGGRFSDLLVERKGTAILTEVPEMFGAETLLMNRCESREVFEQTVKLVNDFKQYFMDHQQTIYEILRREIRREASPRWKISLWDVPRNPAAPW